MASIARNLACAPTPFELTLDDQVHNMRTFLTVTAEGTIANGAARMNKAPSAVSRSLRELEKAAGRSLCERTHRRILPNRHGSMVLARAGRITEELNRAAVELTEERDCKGTHSVSALNEVLFNGRKLRLIERIAETNSVSAAASLCGLTQSGASMALARIENVLGIALFRRGKHVMITTDAAEKLVLRARRVGAEIRHLVAELSADDGRLDGSIVIGTSPLGRTQILPMAIAAALRDHQNIKVTMIESAFGQLLNSLRSGEIDAVVGAAHSDADVSDLAAETLLPDRLAIVARTSHPLARRPLTAVDLRDAHWILPWHQSASRKLFTEGMLSLGFGAPTPSVESADPAVIRQLLVDSDLVALVSARQIRAELDANVLVELTTPLPDMIRQVSLIQRSNALLSPPAQAVIDAIRAQVRSEMP